MRHGAVQADADLLSTRRASHSISEGSRNELSSSYPMFRWDVLCFGGKYFVGQCFTLSDLLARNSWFSYQEPWSNHNQASGQVGRKSQHSPRMR